MPPLPGVSESRSNTQNGRVRPVHHPARLLTAPFALLVLFTGCSSEPPATPAPPPSAAPRPAGLDAARDELAALAAAAQDRHLVARYTLRVDGIADRLIVFTSANDDSWRVDVPAGALGGTADISLAATPDGLFQCGLPSATRPEPASCVRLGERDDTLPRRLDPRVQHPFTDWLKVLTDRRAPLSVSPAMAPPGATGSCYSVETTVASINSPLDAGIYCFDADGTPTAVRAAFGTLTLAAPPEPAPTTVALAGPVVEAEPLGMAAPPVEPSSPISTEPGSTEPGGTVPGGTGPDAATP
ncbi:hypothetical protein SAMN05443287_11383 [Micromonospora phaseoli]|uniref:Uncharacterized protein n=1 Tax=Micromonospora phaseoli TaxID=1144548 RepID=A0A1H7DDS5_9ACTN|nr:hypothetical protein CLV64_11354 [Micromonospora phaseoli]SEJ99963.1 hypothetical protein SAMN05443287_11383 [Micromonospora phaseoli]